jgi:hypothetical protein
MAELAMYANYLDLVVRWGITDEISLLPVSSDSLIEVVPSSLLLCSFLWVSSNVNVVYGLLYVDL